MKALKIFTKVCVIVWLLCRISICYGVCLNDAQDGRCYLCDEHYDYISYRRTDAEQGDKVLTLLVLNPLNNYCDDFIYRKDFVF